MSWRIPNRTLQWRSGLDNFVVGHCNEMAFKAAQVFAMPHFPDYYSPLLLVGTNGTGKTHLLKGIYQRLHQKHPGLAINYTAASSFTKDYTYAVWQNKLKRFEQKYTSVDILLVDDIHLLSGKKATQREFSQIFDSLINQQKKIVLTSSYMPYQISGLSDRLISRLNVGLCVKLVKADYQTRCSILSSIALHYRKRVRSEIVHLIARKVDTDLHDLLEVGRKVAESSIVTNHKTKGIIHSVLNAQ